jgi:hypothetical protein
MNALNHNPPNPRSCITCRRRKLKCDKQSPCSGCKKSRFECGYQVPKASQRKTRSDSNSALKARLEKLEHLVQDLSGNTAKDGAARHEKSSPYSLTASKRNVSKREMGRLVVEEGESRYIENSFWVAMSNEVSDLFFGPRFYNYKDDFPIHNDKRCLKFGISSMNIQMMRAIPLLRLTTHRHGTENRHLFTVSTPLCPISQHFTPALIKYCLCGKFSWTTSTQ